MGVIHTRNDTYVCDRCGHKTAEKSHCEKFRIVTCHGYVGLVRWFVPVMGDYKRIVLCGKCMEKVKDFISTKEGAL